MANLDRFGGQRIYHRKQCLECVDQRFELGDLRTDVAVDADDLEFRRDLGAPVELQRKVHGYAELVLLEACGDIRVRVSVNVGIDPNGNWRGQPQTLRVLDEPIELRFTFDIEAFDGQLERKIQFLAGFSHTGKHHPCGVAAGPQDPFELAAGNDVEPRPEARKQVENG